jgi:hypothetical protein
MYKQGLVTRDQIPADLSLETDEAPDLAFTLLAEMALPLRPSDEVAIEMICNAMATGHGLVHRRRTFQRRYDRVNAAILDAARQELAGADPLRVYDVAVSNGISSVEFFETLAEEFNPDFFGMDYLDSITVVEGPGGWRIVFDNSGRALQAVGGRFVIPLATRVAWRYPVNRILRMWLKRTALPHAAARLGKAGQGVGGADVRRHDVFHPRAHELAARDPRFRLGFGDMYCPIPRRFDLIRAMSVFSNLDDLRIVRAITAMCSSLEDGGLCVVGRNPGRHSDETPTTIFRREGHVLAPIVDLMGGAEQRGLIMGIDLGA